MHHRYIDDEYKDLINKIFTYGLKENFDNRICLKNIVNKYLQEKDTDVYENQIIFDRSIKNLADIDNKKSIILKNYEPKTKVELEGEKRIISILNKIKYNLLDFYLDPIIIVELYKSFKSNKIDSMLNKYSKDGSPIYEVIDQIEIIKNPSKTTSEETIAERVKLRRQKKKKKKKEKKKKIKLRAAEGFKEQEIGLGMKI